MEPMLFYLDLVRRPDELPQSQCQPLEHGAGVEEITQVRLVSPLGDTLSPELLAVVNSGLVSIGTEQEYLMEICFNNGEKGEGADLRPASPLRFHW